MAIDSQDAELWRKVDRSASGPGIAQKDAQAFGETSKADTVSQKPEDTISFNQRVNTQAAANNAQESVDYLRSKAEIPTSDTASTEQSLIGLIRSKLSKIH